MFTWVYAKIWYMQFKIYQLTYLQESIGLNTINNAAELASSCDSGDHLTDQNRTTDSLNTYFWGTFR